MRLLRKEAYQNKEWRNLRDLYLAKHPCCQECEKKGIVNAGTTTEPLQIHHKISPFKNGKVDYSLLLNPDNLETVCAQCHSLIHAKQRGFVSAEDVIRQLDELFEDDNQ